MYKFAVYAEGLLSSGVRQREYVPSREELKKLMFLKDMPAVVSCYGGGSCKIAISPTLTAGTAVARYAVMQYNLLSESPFILPSHY